jgi:O-antigen ligase
MLMNFVADNWLGSGYGSFWNIGPLSPIFTYAGNNGWITRIASGHNGYLDVAAQIGIPGLLLAVIVLILLPIYTLLTNDQIDRSRGALLIASLIFCAGHNVTESTLLDRDMFVQVYLMLTLALLQRARLRTY